MSDGIPWRRVVAHAQEQIERNRTAMETATATDLVSLQAQIRVWRQVIALPETISDEALEPDVSGYT